MKERRRSRFFNVAVDWWESPWLEELPPLSRFAWILLIGHVKMAGRAGVVRYRSPELFARKTALDGKAEAVRVMYEAAVKDGALVIDRTAETIRIVNWAHWQDTRLGGPKGPPRKGGKGGKGKGGDSSESSGSGGSTHSTQHAAPSSRAAHAGDAPAARPGGGGGRSPAEKPDTNWRAEAKTWWKGLTDAERSPLIAAYEQTPAAEEWPVKERGKWRWNAVNQIYLIERGEGGSGDA